MNTSETMRTLKKLAIENVRTAFATSACLTLFCALPCFANAGLPMLMLMAPPMWGLLFVIIPLEAWLAMRGLFLPRRKALEVATIANVVSTIVGVPVTWAILVGFEYLASITALPHLQWRGIGKAPFLLFTFPWLYPFHTDAYWMIPTAGLMLLVPFFFASVWIEFLVARFCIKGVDPQKLKGWAWQANCASYGLLTVICIGLLLTNVVRHEFIAHDDDHRDVEGVTAERLWNLALKRRAVYRGSYEQVKTPPRYKNLKYTLDEYHLNADAALRAGRYKEAENLLKAGVRKFESNNYQRSSTAWMKLADAQNVVFKLAEFYFNQKRYEEAIPLY